MDLTEGALRAYYQRDEERDRLTAGEGKLEFLRTIELISRSLPPAPAVVADIGGGPGRYVDWLVENGYRVVHRDVISGHVGQVQDRYPSPGPVDSAVGDARAVDQADQSVDAVLLLGPLYHLSSARDRRQALVEAGRIVKPGGPVYGAAISRSSLRYEVMIRKRLHLDTPAIFDVVAEAERSGVMPQATATSFSGFTHTPIQLAQEVVDSGLECELVIPVEGPAFVMPDLDDRLDDPVARQELLDNLAVLETAPDMAGFTLHLLALARRPDGWQESGD